MFDLDTYLNDLLLSCRAAFGERLFYVGLQGSWLRGEAHESSDIDVMVILDRFSIQDMDQYREILKRIRYHDLPEGADDSFFLCKELIPGYLDGITGVYQTPKGYYVDDADVEAFDKAFSPKEKLKLPGQLV